LDEFFGDPLIAVPLSRSMEKITCAFSEMKQMQTSSSPFESPIVACLLYLSGGLTI
jgi:hypothetical protein